MISYNICVICYIVQSEESTPNGKVSIAHVKDMCTRLHVCTRFVQVFRMRDIALWPSTNMSIAMILVLAGSRSTVTEITWYIYFCPLKSSCELRNKSELQSESILYHWTLSLDSFRFCEQNNYILLHACSATMQSHSWANNRLYIY